MLLIINIKKWYKVDFWSTWKKVSFSIDSVVKNTEQFVWTFLPTLNKMRNGIFLYLADAAAIIYIFAMNNSCIPEKNLHVAVNLTYQFFRKMFLSYKQSLSRLILLALQALSQM